MVIHVYVVDLFDVYTFMAFIQEWNLGKLLFYVGFFIVAPGCEGSEFSSNLIFYLVLVRYPCTISQGYRIV